MDSFIAILFGFTGANEQVVEDVELANDESDPASGGGCVVV